MKAVEVHLEGEKIKNRDDFHREIKEVLNFPPYYGGNLDALWDMVTGWIPLPVILVWNDFAVSRETMGNVIDPIVETLKEAEAELGGKFQILFK